FLEAVTATLLTLIILVLLRFIERRLLPASSTHVQHLSIEISAPASQLLGQVYDTCTRSGATVEAVKVRIEQEAHTIEVACRIANASALPHIISQLQELPGVHSVHAEMLGKDKKI